MTEHDPRHIPVLAGLVTDLLAAAPGDVALDLTVGLGGHSAMLAEQIGVHGHLIGFDVDEGNLEAARTRLDGVPCRVTLLRENFCDVDRVLAEIGLDRVDVMLADLGVSSTQLDTAERGFSFQSDGPLDMRMDVRLQETAEAIVNRMRERELADLIFGYSQERFSRRIAKRICLVRKEGRIKRTGELVKIVCGAMGVHPDSRKSKIHPATRVFQALRIAVNGEMDALEALLAKAPAVLKPGGRFGVISFHSLEDGMVKRDFRKWKSEGAYEILTKRPMIADPDERDRNPRSRSAKFRVVRRLDS